MVCFNCQKLSFVKLNCISFQANLSKGWKCDGTLIDRGCSVITGGGG